jgi:acyl-CoA reductase-like NAD-dependent aldehyde dehydrogenase
VEALPDRCDEGKTGEIMTESRLRRMLIGGKWVESLAGQQIEVEAPAEQVVFGCVPRGRAEDVDAAVGAASTAFQSWRRMPPRDRGRLIATVGDDIERHIDDIAVEVSRETGNALRTQSRPEIRQAADFFRYFGGIAAEFKGEVVPHNESLLNYNVREPLGVIGGIVPWNSPAMLAAAKITMAIATGNTVVIKSPEDAPLGVMSMAEACHRHLPPGVVNVVSGYGEEAGRALVRHPAVAKISFTGSTSVGREIGRVAGERIAPVLLELGGKSPVLVYPDSDSDAVADGVITGMRFTRMGQGCSAGSRLFVHESIFGSFVDRLVRKLGELRIGDPLDELTDVGSLINRKQYERVCGYIEGGIRDGAKPVTGGMPDGDLPAGYFVRPTIFTDVDPGWRIVREEIFGPVLVAIPWTDEGQAIAMANDTHYGLSAYVWCRDISRAIRAANQLDAGSVQINRGGGPLVGMSSGGIKDSGFGREHSLEAALDDFTYRKSLIVGL